MFLSRYCPVRSREKHLYELKLAIPRKKSLHSSHLEKKIFITCPVVPITGISNVASTRVGPVSVFTYSTLLWTWSPFAFINVCKKIKRHFRVPVKVYLRPFIEWRRGLVRGINESDFWSPWDIRLMLVWGHMSEKFTISSLQVIFGFTLELPVSCVWSEK